MTTELQKLQSDIDHLESATASAIADLRQRIAAIGTAVAITFSIGMKADQEEFQLAYDFGVKLVTTSTWPGGGLSADAIAFGASGKLTIIPRYQREAQDGNPPLMPLTTQAEIDAFLRTLDSDLDAYDRANVKWMALGNEPDGTKDGKPRFWGAALKDFGPTWGKYAAPKVRARGIGIIWELPVDPARCAEFVKGLVDSGAYKVGDRFSFHAYQSNAAAHIARFQKAIDGVRSVLPHVTAADFDSLEWGIALGGSDAGKLDQINKLFEYTPTIGIGRCFFYRMRRNENYLKDFSFNAPLHTDNTHTFSYDLLKSKFSA